MQKKIKQKLLTDGGYCQLLTRTQGKQINITLIHVYAQTMNTEETEAKQCYSNVQHTVDTTPLKKASFHLLN